MVSSFFNNFTENPKNDILSGITVALALVPEAVAFAFVAGIDPIIGLYGAFFMALITSLFGGRPGMISGATGAMAVVMVHLIIKGNQIGQTLEVPIDNLGVYWLFICLLFTGLIQILIGVLKLGKFVRLIPFPVMMGFVNGLAIIIFLSQLDFFKVESNGISTWISGTALYMMLGLIALAMLVMYFIPKITKLVPGALAAIILVAAVVNIFQLDVNTVGSFIRQGGGDGLQASLPHFQYQIFQINATLQGNMALILSTAAILAAVGLIETLLTLNLIDDMTDTRGSGNRECVAQGGANIINGLFGGMGGCAMIGQSIINIKSGGRGRLSGVVAATALLIFILFTAPLIEAIPIAALVGVMFMVVIGTFAWSSFRIMNKIPLADALVIVIVAAVTVWMDLAIAVLVGVIISALVFSWQNATRIRARKRLKDDGTKVYEIWGPLFFGSAKTFASKFDIQSDPSHIEIDFMESKVTDHSGIEAIRNIANKYIDAGKDLKLTHLSPDCIRILTKFNPEFNSIIASSVEDPRYYVVTDMLDQEV